MTIKKLMLMLMLILGRRRSIYTVIIIKIIKREFTRRSNMARVTTKEPYNVRCSYLGNS